MKINQPLKFLAVIKAVGKKVSFLTIYRPNFLMNVDTWREEKIILGEPEEFVDIICHYPVL